MGLVYSKKRNEKDEAALVAKKNAECRSAIDYSGHPRQNQHSADAYVYVTCTSPFDSVQSPARLESVVTLLKTAVLKSNQPYGLTSPSSTLSISSQ